MGVGDRDGGYPFGVVQNHERSDPMSEHFDSRNAAAAFDHDSTLVVALELSGKSWEIGAIVPGLARRPRRRLDPRDVAGLLRSLERWKSEAGAAGRMIDRVVLTYEAGRDGFWIARSLQAQGIEVHVVHPASVPVPRGRRRAKTDRTDRDMRLRTFPCWLCGEPRVCSMVRVPSEAEEEKRRPGRERERLVAERIELENRIESLLFLHGAAGFKPRPKTAPDTREALGDFAGAPLRVRTLAQRRRSRVRNQA